MAFGRMDARLSTDHGLQAAPTVSVIIPVWNVEPYLRECLDSVLGQSIGLERLEVIAVDDGSTDGSGALLDDYAARCPRVRVFHQPNSGGPGRPRNVGLDHANGTYVFFLDADDYLGPEALERLVAMAERNGSDIVLGKMVGVDGRPVPMGAFRRNLERAHVEQVYSTLTALKLFRRAFLERLRLRFEEGLPGGEDGLFTARAYLEAETISVVADYDCYYCRERLGSQTRSSTREDDLAGYLDRVKERIELVARYTEPGPARDRLMTRHIWDVVRAFKTRWRLLEPEERRQLFETGSALIKRWHTDRIQRSLPAWLAIRAYCLRHDLPTELEEILACPGEIAFGDPIVEGRRVFARYPHFRHTCGIPDSCFEITDRIELRQQDVRVELVGHTLRLSGKAYLSLLGGSTTIILRRWPWGREFSFPTDPVPTPRLRDMQVPYPNAGFSVTIDLAAVADGRPLLPGSWDVLVSVGTRRVRRRARLRVSDVPAADRSAVRHAGYASDRRAVLEVSRAGDIRLRLGAVARLRGWLERGVGVHPRIWRLARLLSERLAVYGSPARPRVSVRARRAPQRADTTGR